VEGKEGRVVPYRDTEHRYRLVLVLVLGLVLGLVLVLVLVLGLRCFAPASILVERCGSLGLGRRSVRG